MLPAKHPFTALGTQWQIDTIEPLTAELQQAIHDRIEAFDRTYSRFRDDSLIQQIARAAGTYEFPPDAAPLFTFYRDLYEQTGGAVTPLIGNALERAGYDTTYSLTPQKQTAIPAWDDVLRIDGTTITTTEPLTLDVGAAGKGYLVDIISELLEGSGITEYVVDGSGDLRHRGQSRNVVGLEHPLEPGLIIGTVAVENASLCASSTTRRTWGEGLHHIFNPHTLTPVDDIVATWVITTQTLHADGLATALFFAEPSALAQRYAFDYVRYHRDGSVDYSRNFQGELF